MEMNSESIAFQLISKGGDASSKFMKAFQAAQAGNMKEARALVAEGEASLEEAHKVQTQMIMKEAAGESFEMGVLMIHAQDHLMNAMLIKELTSHILELYARTGIDKE